MSSLEVPGSQSSEPRDRNSQPVSVLSQVMDRLRKGNRAFAAFCAHAEGICGQPLLSLLMNPIQVRQ